MDLRTFVCETLCQIQEGVQDAIERRSGQGGLINPHFSEYAEDKQKVVEKVMFDVAVTATEEQEREGKAGLRVWSVGVGGSAKGTTASETVSRVQFAVPIVPPTMTVERDRSEATRRRNDAAMESARVVRRDPLA